MEIFLESMKIIYQEEKWCHFVSYFCIIHLGFPCGSAGKESICNMGDLDLIPGLGRSSGGGKGYPLQYSSLENSIYLSSIYSSFNTNLKQF